jgi:gluconolactonase
MSRHSVIQHPAHRLDGKKLTGPNDVVVKSEGSIWFSDNLAG